MDRVKAFDKPGMIEAKILLPNSTSTPLKPFGSSFQNHSLSVDGYGVISQSPNWSLESRMSKNSPAFDSGYNSLLGEEKDQERRVASESLSEGNNSSSDESRTEKPSLFESILKSRNHSLSLEQLIEKVNLKKEFKNADSPRGRGRFRSFSASEVYRSSRRPISSQATSISSRSSVSNLSLYSDLSVGSSSVTEFESQSPMDQVFLLSANRHRQPRHTPDRLRSCSGGDYDLSELVASMSLVPGHSRSACVPSPDAATYRRTPESLFGLEALQGFQGQGRAESMRPKLESITETEQDLTGTPEEYYTTGLSPRPTLPSFMSHYGHTTVSGFRAPGRECSIDPGEPHNSTWSGLLPQKFYSNPVYSCKIFLGGVPWDVTEVSLVQAFSPFGNIRIEWPGKEQSPSPPKGYVYIVFDQERNVSSLLSQCSQSNGAYYFKISSRRMRSKEVQIIPWVLEDSNFIKNPKQKLDPQKTVFVGALHGMLNADILQKIFNDLFGGVVYAGIDTDKHKYPIGSGRVTFSSIRSYMKAVSAAYVEIKCQQFNKKVQVDPYLEDALCSSCLLKQGPYFCRDLMCFKYFCRHCWEAAHSLELLRSHKPLMRNTRAGGGPATRPTISLTPNVGNLDSSILS